MLTKLPPVRCNLFGVRDLEDLYFQPGDPMAHMTDLCSASIVWLCGIDLDPMSTIRISADLKSDGEAFIIDKQED